MSPKYEFFNTEWLAAFHAAMATTIAASAAEWPELSFSMAEVATNAPPHLSGGAGSVGWSCFVENARLVHWGRGDEDAIAHKIIAPYDVMIDLSRFVIDGDKARGEQYRAWTAALVQDGSIVAFGQRPRLPRPFAVIHDVIARMTL